MRLQFVAAIPIFGLVAGSLQLEAQPATKLPTTDAKEVAHQLRSRGDPGMAVQVLTQRYGPQPAAKLDAIGDTLVAVALHFRGDSSKAIYARQAALLALATASKGGRDGMPYAGGPERLLRLVNEGHSGGALWAITQLPDQTLALELVTGVARSNNGMARAAVEELANSLGPRGLTTLRRLFERDEIVDPEAKRTVGAIAFNLKWK